jgi:hypothetical protein
VLVLSLSSDFFNFFLATLVISTQFSVFMIIKLVGTIFRELQ